jgi:Cu/Ag efflux protein CusF
MKSILLVFAAAILAACSSSPEPGGPVQSYDVHGVVAQLPAGPGKEFMIQHDPIPDFVNAEGDTVGMNAMTMGFPPAEDLDLSGFTVGDSIRFTFEVRWGQPGPLRLTRIEHAGP